VYKNIPANPTAAGTHHPCACPNKIWAGNVTMKANGTNHKKIYRHHPLKI
jgi:hypothetical protein